MTQKLTGYAGLNHIKCICSGPHAGQSETPDACLINLSTAEIRKCESWKI